MRVVQSATRRDKQTNEEVQCTTTGTRQIYYGFILEKKKHWIGHNTQMRNPAKLIEGRMMGKIPWGRK